MSIESGKSAYEAFENQLTTLCLNEFPCGLGTWRTDQDSISSKYVVTLKDCGVQREPGEALEELITSKFSPYSVDYSWSDEAQKLRETAVQTPWVVNEQFIQQHFKTLRIVNKQVNEVDERFLGFPNLKELTLSANQLESISSKNLPVSLEVLELAANNISDLEPLSDAPPPDLQHLGLAHNKISFISDYLTQQYWPNLLSLDLSHNNLCGLPDIVHQLSSLNKLRNLSLIANPLALIPGYRGFVVDSFRHLLILDDLRISADEKHHFKGLARRKDLIQDETKLTIQINHLTGVPMPEEMQATEDLPEFPIIERRYYVEFNFLEDKSRIDARLDEIEAVQIEIQKKEFNAEDEKTQISGADVDGVKQVNGAAIVNNNTKSNGSYKNMTNNVMSANDQVPAQPAYAQYCTDKIAWNVDGLQLKFNTELIFEDLPALKESLKHGMHVLVKEDKVLCTPLDELLCDGRTSASSKRGSNKEKHRKDSAKNEKPKEQKDKGKKKKKEPEIELARSTPEVRILAQYHIPLVDFVEGEHNYSNECIFKVQEENEIEKDDVYENDEAKEKKKKKDSAKTTKVKEIKEKPHEKEKGSKKTPVKVEKKDGKKRPPSGKSHQSEEGDEKLPPVPVIAHIDVMLHEWKTAQDAVA